MRPESWKWIRTKSFRNFAKSFFVRKNHTHTQLTFTVGCVSACCVLLCANRLCCGSIQRHIHQVRFVITQINVKYIWCSDSCSFEKKKFFFPSSGTQLFVVFAHSVGLSFLFAHIHRTVHDDDGENAALTDRCSQTDWKEEKEKTIERSTEERRKAIITRFVPRAAVSSRFEKDKKISGENGDNKNRKVCFIILCSWM